ncbi:MAG: hypothetical protein AAFV88_01680 [Planctomycetota bacterium]
MSDTLLISDDHPVDPDDELLVAYLDDELSTEARVQVEKRLIKDPSFQKRLQALQTGWEWLDDFPAESADERLVESTLELVVADVEAAGKAPADRKAGVLRTHWKQIGTVLLLPVALVAGIAFSKVRAQRLLNRDLFDLALAENFDAYRLVQDEGDLQLYVKLANNDSWQTMVKAMQRIRARELETPSIVDAIPMEDRATKVAELPNETRQKLTTRWETFSGLNRNAKDQIKRSAERVAAQANHESLLQTLRAAAVWLEGLSDELRDRIQQGDAEVQSEAITEAIELTMADLEADSGRMISDTTADRIYFWVSTLLQERLNQAPRDRLLRFKQINPRTRELVEHHLMLVMIDDRKTREVFANRMRSFSRGLMGPPRGGGNSGGRRGEERRPDGPGRSEGQRRPPEGDRGPGRGDPLSNLPPIEDAEFEQLKYLLDDQALEDLKQVTALFRNYGGDAVANETLRSWAYEAVRRNAPFYRDELMDRYEQIEDRDAFDLSPPDTITLGLFSASGEELGSSQTKK